MRGLLQISIKHLRCSKVLSPKTVRDPLCSVGTIQQDSLGGCHLGQCAPSTVEGESKEDRSFALLLMVFTQGMKTADCYREALWID